LFYEDENNENRIRKVIDLYKSIVSQEGLTDFENVFRKSLNTNPEERYFRYSELRNAINKLFEVINHTPEKPFAIHCVDQIYITEFLREANSEGLSFSVSENRHPQFKNVSTRISSNNFYAHTCFSSNKGNCLEVIGLKKIDSLEENEKANHSRVLFKGVKLSGVNFIQLKPNETNIDNFYDVFNFLEKLFQDKQESTPHTLSRTPREILSNYKLLLDEEINYLRNNAFRVKYSDFEVQGSSEAAFHIVLDEKVSLEDVFNFLKRSQASFRKGNEVALASTKDATGISNKESVGFSTRFDRKKNVLYVRDFPAKRKEEIPHRGFLVEDTSLMEIQYKRQINAIKNYENDNITNSELRKYLFQPENLKDLADSSGQIIAELEVISTDKKGDKVQFEDAQKDAILKSLYRPPITIIQGPPGTGKTTVITELIRQILAKDNQAKILITSQTNLAVDNVLQKMAKIPGISFIRLGKTVEDSEISEHSFENKLNLWAKEPSPVEVINDTNKEVINFYQVAQKEFPALQEEIRATLHSREQHRQAIIVYENPDLFTPVKRAWAFWVLSCQSYSASIACGWRYGRSKKVESLISKKRDNFIATIRERLELTQIECNDAIRVIESRDTPDTFFYCDPPYFNANMGHYGGYSRQDFANLLNTLANIKGKFLLSSYPSDLLKEYTQKQGWKTFVIHRKLGMRKEGERNKTEVLTMNYEIDRASSLDPA
jgi:DNA adenine methylase